VRKGVSVTVGMAGIGGCGGYVRVVDSEIGQGDYGVGRLGSVFCCFWPAYKSQLFRIYLLPNDNSVCQNFLRGGPLPLAVFTATQLRCATICTSSQ